ncbi:hypothetical protein D3C76_826600 [compost metagenome]
MRQQFRQVHGLLQGLLAAGVIHWPAVIRIDQGEVPVVVALIQVRYAGHGHAQQGLRQSVEGAGQGDRAGYLAESGA